VASHEWRGSSQLVACQVALGSHGMDELVPNPNLSGKLGF